MVPCRSRLLLGAWSLVIRRGYVRTSVQVWPDTDGFIRAQRHSPVSLYVGVMGRRQQCQLRAMMAARKNSGSQQIAESATDLKQLHVVSMAGAAPQMESMRIVCHRPCIHPERGCRW
jgi:hypothetical protein